MPKLQVTYILQAEQGQDPDTLSRTLDNGDLGCEAENAPRNATAFYYNMGPQMKIYFIDGKVWTLRELEWVEGYDAQRTVLIMKSNDWSHVVRDRFGGFHPFDDEFQQVVSTASQTTSS